MPVVGPSGGDDAIRRIQNDETCEPKFHDQVQWLQRWLFLFSRLLAGLKRSRKDAEVFFGLVDRPGWGGQRTGKINIPQHKNQRAFLHSVLFRFWMSIYFWNAAQKGMNINKYASLGWTKRKCDG